MDGNTKKTAPEHLQGSQQRGPDVLIEGVKGLSIGGVPHIDLIKAESVVVEEKRPDAEWASRVKKSSASSPLQREVLSEQSFKEKDVSSAQAGKHSFLMRASAEGTLYKKLFAPQEESTEWKEVVGAFYRKRMPVSVSENLEESVGEENISEENISEESVDEEGANYEIKKVGAANFRKYIHYLDGKIIASDNKEPGSLDDESYHECCDVQERLQSLFKEYFNPKQRSSGTSFDKQWNSILDMMESSDVAPITKVYNDLIGKINAD